LIEINAYYNDQYKNHIYLWKMIILFCIPLIIFTLLYNYSLLPSWLYSTLFIITLLIAIIFISFQLYMNSYRDNMVYNEFNWSPPTSNNKIIRKDNTSGENPWQVPELTFCPTLTNTSNQLLNTSYQFGSDALNTLDKTNFFGLTTIQQ